MDKIFATLMAIVGYDLTTAGKWSAAAFRALKRTYRNLIFTTMGCFVLALIAAFIPAWTIRVGVLLVISFFYFVLDAFILFNKRAFNAAGLLLAGDAVLNITLFLRGLSITEIESPLLKAKFDIKKNEPENPKFELALLVGAWEVLQVLLCCFMAAVQYFMLVPVWVNPWLFALSLFMGISWLVRHKPTGFDFFSWLGSFNGYAFVGNSAYLFTKGILLNIYGDKAPNHPRLIEFYPVLAGIVAFVMIALFANRNEWLKKGASKRDHYQLEVGLGALALLLLPLAYKWFSHSTGTGPFFGLDGSFRLPVLPDWFNQMVFSPTPWTASGITLVLFISAFLIASLLPKALKAFVSVPLLIAAGVYGWWVMAPSFQTQGERVEKQAEQEWRNGDRAQVKEFAQKARPVQAGFVGPDGTINVDPAKLNMLGIEQGRKAFELKTGLLRFKAEAAGLTTGDFSVPANLAVRPLPGTAELDPTTLYDTGKQVCQPKTLVMHGRVNSDEYISVLNRWTDGRGWVDRNGRRDPDPDNYRDSGNHKIVEAAPFMAALVYVGSNRPRYDWVPVKSDPNGTVTAVALTLNVSECQDIRMAWNDYFATNSYEPKADLESQARNVGSEPIELRLDGRKGGTGVQVVIQ